MENDKRKNKIDIILIIILSILIITYLVIFAISALSNEKTITIGNTKFFIAMNDDYNGSLKAGDLVIVNSKDKISQGDVIIYTSGNDTTVKTITSSADLNDANMTIEGKVVGKIHNLGKLALFIQTPMGTIIFALIIICIILIIKFIDANSRKEKVVNKIDNTCK